MGEEEAVIICVPTSESHVENVTVEKCVCGIDVWLATTSISAVKSKGFSTYKTVCLNCAEKQMSEEQTVKTVMPTQEQVTELAAETGYSEDFMRREMEAIIKSHIIAARARLN